MNFTRRSYRMRLHANAFSTHQSSRWDDWWVEPKKYTFFRSIGTFGVVTIAPNRNSDC